MMVVRLTNMTKDSGSSYRHSSWTYLPITPNMLAHHVLSRLFTAHFFVLVLFCILFIFFLMWFASIKFLQGV